MSDFETYWRQLSEKNKFPEELDEYGGTISLTELKKQLAFAYRQGAIDGVTIHQRMIAARPVNFPGRQSLLRRIFG